VRPAAVSESSWRCPCHLRVRVRLGVRARLRLRLRLRLSLRLRLGRRRRRRRRRRVSLRARVRRWPCLQSAARQPYISLYLPYISPISPLYLTSQPPDSRAAAAALAGPARPRLLRRLLGLG
jgi:hypothetical protein